MVRAVGVSPERRRAAGRDRPVRRHVGDGGEPRHAVRLPADRRRRGGPAAGDARARRPQRRRGDRRRAARSLRSTAGTLESPLGEITAIASEHDEQAGTARGPNTIFVFALDGLRVCHFGDFGQRGLRDEQAAAIGEIDLLILPVGGGPTIGAAAGGVDRRAAVAALGGADALPHAAHRLPRDRRRLPRPLRARRALSRARRSRPASCRAPTARWSSCRRRRSREAHAATRAV